MQQMPWNMQKIKQCEKETEQALLRDELTLASYGQDFGKLSQSQPSVVCTPPSVEKLQSLLAFADQHELAVTIRAKGLSQGGQSVPLQGGLSLCLANLNQVLATEEDAIWIEANASWADLLEQSLKQNKIPYVLPYNCNLSIGGVLSAGGLGAASFKYGPVTAHVKALEVVLASGESRFVDSQSSLFRACLSGQGRFGVITKACIKLRPCQKQVRTFFLTYLDKGQWLEDLAILCGKADYLETFCSPSIQGAKLLGAKRVPFAQWLYSIHISMEYEGKVPELQDVCGALNPWKVQHHQDEGIRSYLHRHDHRFEVMKMTGQWELFHPWYECFLPASLAASSLDQLLEELPLHYATILQLVPIANKQQTGFFMLPETDMVYELMILNPGVIQAFVPSCLEAIETMDKQFLKQGGKRYLSGYLGRNLPQDYWQKHFGAYYRDWVDLKREYDSRQIFSSLLHQPVYPISRSVY